MGLTRQYLRYAAVDTFGVVGSGKSNITKLNWKGTVGRFCAVGACEDVIIWDLRKQEKVQTLRGSKEEVTKIASSPDKKHVAVGYTDGAVRVFDLDHSDAKVTFSGHKTAVTALNYDTDGMRLVSGSKDTDVIVWDIVNEAGLYRLHGHKGTVTQARFMTKYNILITSSKDTFVKFWDMDTQHCFHTVVGHRAEVWDFVLVRDDRYLVTGSSDSELRVWRLATPDHVSESESKKRKMEENSDEEEDEEKILHCSKAGSFMRRGRDRVVSMTTDPSGRLLGCHGSETTLELFRISTEEEITKSMKKKQKRARKRKAEGETEDEEIIKQTLEDEIKRISPIKATSKIRSFDCLLDKQGIVWALLLLSNNSLAQYSLNSKEKHAEASQGGVLTAPGHRSDVRTLSFSSDNTALLSASGETLKVWNRTSLQCIRTISCGYALCSLFAPGDRHIIIGTKTGKLEIFDLAAGTLLESIDAHDGAVWSVCLAPDKRSIVSGSADHLVKFWDFELVEQEELSSKCLSLVHTRTLKMSEDVLCVKFSPDQRLLAVALLDNTVKVFFVDTLKFFLSLYGHKLPVLCMDISSDSSLIITGSADRNVKLWGLDFGDCHKSIFAHDDSIMCVQFVPRTHMFFTGGKDGKLKEWDGDNFEHIITLEGHHAELWSLAVSPSGNFVVTASHDKSLRLWEKTQEPLVLEEEREMEREKEEEEATKHEGPSKVPGETAGETGIAGKKTVETVKAAERLMEALELHKEETGKLILHQQECQAAGRELEKPALHPMFMAFKVTSPDRYMLEVLKKVRSSELEESLLVLPFSYATQLLEVLNTFLESGWEPELTCRCLFFLLRIHQGQITTNQVLLSVVEKLRSSSESRVKTMRDRIGFNLAGLRFLKQQVEEKEEVKFFVDATGRFTQKKKKSKRRMLLTIKS